MNRTDLFLWLAGALFLILLIVGVGYVRRILILRKKEWPDLLRELQAINKSGFESVVFDAINQSGEERTDDDAKELDFDEIWEFLGGMDGLARIEHNSRVLIEMAGYLQRWYPEALTTAEHLRLQARELEWHVGRLKMAEKNQGLRFYFASYGQNAAVLYYQMCQSLLAVYKESKAPMFFELQAAL